MKNRAEAARIRKLLEGLTQPAREQTSPTPQSTAPLAGLQIVAELCRSAGYSEKQMLWLMIQAAAVGLAGLVCAVILGALWPLCGAVSALAAFWLRLKLRVRARVEAFEKDYTAFLLSTAAAVRSGHDPLQALLHAEQLFTEQSEIGKELSGFKDALARGATEEQAISEFAASIAHPDLPLFKLAFLFSRRHGSSFAGALQRLTRVTRNRQSFRRKISAAVALQKVSALGIGAAALVIGLIQWSANQDGLKLAWRHPVGAQLLLASVTLIVGGVLWMFCMTTRRI